MRAASGSLAETTTATDPAVEWLLKSKEPAIRYLTRCDVLGERAQPDAEEILEGPIVRGLLSGQQADGGFGGHPYHRKWSGAHWRLISLVELGVPAGNRKALAAADTVLDWLTSESHLRRIPVINGLTRRCASQEGNALAVSCRLGMAADSRVEGLARSLITWQWPDGGWNCDAKASGRRSSFHESLPPIWGLHEYARATGAAWAEAAAHRAAELLLSHRIFRAGGTGPPIHPSFVVLHYPPYWHYDFLQALYVLGRLGKLSDERADDALDLLVKRRRPNGRWRSGGRWWRPPGSDTYPEAVDWGPDGADEMITLNALRVLKMAGRSE
jgi:hypothetical protein